MATVLIVDDDHMTRKLLVRFLASIGVIGEAVTNGEAAFEYLRTHRPELVLLDLMMPEMDGIDILWTIRTDPTTNEVPVIMYTAATNPAAEEQAKNLGVNEYWIKGAVDILTMENSLNSYLRQAA